MSAPLVVFDADVLGRRRTGDERYVENLLRELPGLTADIRFAAVTRHPERLPPGVEPLLLPAGSQLARVAWGLPRLLQRVEPALAHFQYVVPPLYRGRAVVTVHDLSFEREPWTMTRGDRALFRTFVPRSVRRAERVLAVSELTRRDLIELYGVPEEKVVVTPLGVHPRFAPDGQPPTEPPYALVLGALQPRKGPLTAVEALARLPGDLRLVFAGPEKRGGEEVRRAVARLELEARVEFRGHVPEEELPDLYRAAACLVLPSYYEGFGLPVLEAMACGTPVVTTTAGALPEVAGDAAVLVAPGDPEALAAGIEQALAEAERLRAAGIVRASEFSWTETARRTLAVYEELL